MERNYVESSMISSIGYDASLAILEVEFTSGAVWQYHEFQESLWYEFESSDSKGKFFLREIKGQYPENKVG